MGVNGERGQMMILAALSLAFILITLSIILNSGMFVGMYTMSDESRPDAELAKDEMQENIGGLLETTNNQNGGASYSTLNSEFDSRFNEFKPLYEERMAGGGAGTRISVASTDEGTRIYQEPSDTFDDSNGNLIWTLVSNTQEFRKFRITFDENSLQDGDNLNDPDTTVQDLLKADVFRIKFEDTDGQVWTTYFYRRTSDNDLFIRVEYPDGTLSGECKAETPDGTATVNLANAKVNGQDLCPEFQFIDDMDKPVTISFEDSQNAAGTYELLVSKDNSNVDSTPYGSNPYKEQILYSADIRFKHLSKGTTYSNVVTVAPEDADNDYND